MNFVFATFDILAAALLRTPSILESDALFRSDSCGFGRHCLLHLGVKDKDAMILRNLANYSPNNTAIHHTLSTVYFFQLRTVAF